MSGTRPRCAGCGKEIGPGQKAVTVLQGAYKATFEFEANGVWGSMHRPCFSRAIDDPNDALEEIRRIAKPK